MNIKKSSVLAASFAVLSSHAGNPLQEKRDHVVGLLAMGDEGDTLRFAFDAFIAELGSSPEDFSLREAEILIAQMSQFDLPEVIRPSLLEFQRRLTERILSGAHTTAVLRTTFADLVGLRITHEVMAGSTSVGVEVKALTSASKALASLLDQGLLESNNVAQRQVVWAASTLLSRPEVRRDPALTNEVFKSIYYNKKVFKAAAEEQAPREFFRGSFVRASDRNLESFTEEILTTLSRGAWDMDQLAIRARDFHDYVKGQNECRRAARMAAASDGK